MVAVTVVLSSSICLKQRHWCVIVENKEHFKQTTDSTSNSVYTFGSHGVKHNFCKTCGISVFADCNIEGMGEFFAVCINVIDDLTPEQLDVLQVNYTNGKDNDWFAPPAITKYL
ncbi:hypothetical protein PPL_12122 [Heterostelium album PN500]|uniref:CENP-V/GFA domain-containing protein n=1 Tax=Heterostelium pallidum (strain ATCC 26659 / Pp 5 / PN500) TaxID=670386 RepID=D3BLR9_HETP5|nr:hypothetical protein PPL_12122 [Heterostelium album PN500]EFA77520.1 hypothetical protein PPL_12122 [Heterostelium album PN500]|eukprot:XP_020429648.1 hypothetical protein PPL_12122 [Heterostelium album PN500]